MENETKPLSPEDTTLHVTELQSLDNTTSHVTELQPFDSTTLHVTELQSLDSTIIPIPDEQNRRTNTSCCTPCRMKNIGIFGVLALAAFIGIGYGIHYVVKNNSNTTTGEKNSSNTTTGNTSSLTNVVRQPGKVDGCIYTTPQDYLKELKEDPFGKDCEHGSSYVDKTCNTPNAGYHLCEKKAKCEGKRLPSVCFCDKKIHCPKPGGGKPHDGDGKESCSDCLNAFNISKYQNHGTCQCDKRKLKCVCKNGFGQFMCSAILKRICKLNATKSRPRCNQANVEQCSVKTDDNKEYICDVFKDSDDELIKTLPSCR